LNEDEFIVYWIEESYSVFGKHA